MNFSVLVQFLVWYQCLLLTVEQLMLMCKYWFTVLGAEWITYLLYLWLYLWCFV